MSVFRLRFKLAFSQKQLWLWGSVLSLVFALAIVSVSVLSYYRRRLLPNIYVDQIPVGSLTQAEAYDKIVKASTVNSLKKEILPNEPKTRLIISAHDHRQQTHFQELTFSQFSRGKDYERAIAKAFELGRQKNLLVDATSFIKLLTQPHHIASPYKFNQNQIRQVLKELKTIVDFEGEPHQLALKTSGDPNTITFQQGENGLLLQEEISLNNILRLLEESINSGKTEEKPEAISTVAEIKLIVYELTEDEISAGKNRAEKFVDSKLFFYGFKDEDSDSLQKPEDDEKPTGWIVEKTLNDQELIALLSWPSGINQSEVDNLVDDWAENINQPTVNAEFEYESKTLKVTKFHPGQNGIEVDEKEIRETIVAFIERMDTIEVVGGNETDNLTGNLDSEKQKIVYILLKQTEPEVRLADTNDLGIKELIGFGDSHYYGSIAPRLHNIKVASEKLNFTIVPPGENFSFNQTVGEVNRDTGFQQAYVIRAGRTLMEFGGGVCQVSTTTFRAFLDAGVNITRRLPHSYRVSYYEFHNKPGYDATVYSGNVDLRFENDTPGHILITAEADSSKAYMTVKLYGTNDGRHTEIKNHKQWGYASPPPPQEIPDESLAPGQRRKVENAIPGLRVSFDWLVTDKNGEVIHEKTFYSNYQAWGEKWLVGI